MAPTSHIVRITCCPMALTSQLARITCCPMALASHITRTTCVFALVLTVSAQNFAFAQPATQEKSKSIPKAIDERAEVADNNGNGDEVSDNNKEGDNTEGDKAKSAQKKEKPPEFVRVHKIDKKLQALQTASVTYTKPGEENGVEVTLIGAVHIAEPTYYSRLNQLFMGFDALLYELVADPEMGIPDPEERGVSPISSIQVGMKDALELAFQLDEIDYKAENFVHADMTPEEFFSTMENRKEGVFQMLFRSMGAGLAMQSSGKSSDIDLISALMANNRGRALRRTLAEQMGTMDGQMAAITGEDGKSTLITERNAKAFQVMDREIESGKKKLGIFYGAGHLKDMHKRLVEDYGMQPIKTEWLDAWDLK